MHVRPLAHNMSRRIQAILAARPRTRRRGKLQPGDPRWVVQQQCVEPPRCLPQQQQPREPQQQQRRALREDLEILHARTRRDPQATACGCVVNQSPPSPSRCLLPSERHEHCPKRAPWAPRFPSRLCTRAIACSVYAAGGGLPNRADYVLRTQAKRASSCLQSARVSPCWACASQARTRHTTSPASMAPAS